jgi:NAD(P)H-flavin reductase
MKAGQFVTFILPNIGGRSYSILEEKENTIILTIKKREKKNGGR